MGLYQMRLQCDRSLEALINVNFKDKTDLKMLEIGSFAGESAELFLKTNKISELHCMDPWENYEDPADIASIQNHLAEIEFDKRFKNVSSVIKHKGFSYNLVNEFENNYFDIIYIDGCHLYEAVKQDILLYLPKIKETRCISRT
jgi:hypothetical protein